MPPEALVLAVALALVSLAGLSLLALRDKQLVRISRRYLERRPGRALLIILGLLPATALIVTALVVSDTLTLAVQRAAVAQVGRVDEEISRDSGGLAVFPQAIAAGVQARLRSDERKSGVMAALLVDQTLVIDENQQQAHSAINVLGVDDTGDEGPLGEWRLQDGGVVHAGNLNANQAFMNRSAADLLQSVPGDDVTVYSVHWSGRQVRTQIRGIIASGPLGSRPTIIVPLTSLQSVASAEAQINRIYIANAGDGLSGVEYSRAIANRIQTELPAGLAVHLVKNNALQLALQAKTLFSRILGLYTLFALAVEALLIFLIFSLLAAERRSQLATLRVLGAQRGAIVELLLFEAVIYTLAAAAPGAALGLGIGYLLVIVLSPAAAHLGITLQLGFEPNGFFAALSASVLFALLVAAVAAWFTSGLTIAAAMRGTSSVMEGSTLLPRIPALLWLSQTLRTRPDARWVRWARISALHWRWFVPVALMCVALLAPLSHDGLALALRALALSLGVVLLARWIYLRRRAAAIRVLPEESRLLALAQARRTADRISAFAVGGWILVYWGTPQAWFGGLSRFNGGIATFFIAGMLMVVGAVLAVTPNFDVMLRPMQRGLAHLGRQRHAMIVGLRYVASQPLRTGIGFALFGLVCFVMVVMACIATSTAQRYTDISALTGGYDIIGRPLSHPLTGVDALRSRLQDRAPAAARQIEQISLASSLPLAVLQPNSASAGWRLYPAAQIDGAFLQGAGLPLAARAEGFTSDTAVWQAVASQPGHVVIDAAALTPSEAAALGAQTPPLPELTDFAAPPIAATLLGPTSLTATLSQTSTQELLQQAPPEVRDLLSDSAKVHHFTLQLTKIGAHAGAFTPFKLWVGDFRSATPVVQVTVVGIVDNVQGQRYGLLGSPATFRSIEAQVSSVSGAYYYFRLAPGASAANLARSIGSALIENGFETTVVRTTLLTQNAPAIFASELLLRLVSVLLLVGVAALMITALRAVAERRQQIGLLRALGFQRREVIVVFAVETLVIALGGAVAGLVIGLALCYNALTATFLDEAHIGLTLVIPWGTLAGILITAVLCALAAIVVPARLASRIAPAEALRYE